MKELLARTTITSLIALIIIAVGFVFRFCMAFIPTEITDSLKTQLSQDNSGIMMLAAAFYFTANHKTRGDDKGIG